MPCESVSVGMLGSFSLPHLLQMQAEAATGVKAKAKSIIFLFLEGGPSTIDLWDLKPEGPRRDSRGPYNRSARTCRGRSSASTCRSVRRSPTSTRSFARTATRTTVTARYHYMMTGYKASFADGQGGGAPVNHLFPSLGSIVSRELGPRGNIPCYINLPNPMEAGGPGFYGPEHAPFVLETDPVQPDFEVRDLRLAPGVDGKRLDDRRKILSMIDRLSATPRPRAPG